LGTPWAAWCLGRRGRLLQRRLGRLMLGPPEPTCAVDALGAPGPPAVGGLGRSMVRVRGHLLGPDERCYTHAP